MTVDDGVQEFLDGVPDDHRPIVDSIRDLLFDVYPDTSETIKWNKLTYVIDGENRFYVDHYTEHVSLGFMQGSALHDPDGLLEGTGKNMRHIKFRDATDVENPAVRSLVEKTV